MHVHTMFPTALTANGLKLVLVVHTDLVGGQLREVLLQMIAGARAPADVPACLC